LRTLGQIALLLSASQKLEMSAGMVAAIFLSAGVGVSLGAIGGGGSGQQLQKTFAWFIIILGLVMEGLP
jgi:hypothetical protein